MFNLFLFQQNSWLFEINKHARWFYRWEVGPTRERRFKPHVFEAYLLYSLDPQQKQAPGIRTAQDLQKDFWRVLAVACSPNFTLISSRRAPDGGISRNNGADDELEDENQEDGEPYDVSRGSVDGSLSTSDTEEGQVPTLPLLPRKPQTADAVSTQIVAPRTISQQFAVFSWILDQLPLTGLLQHISAMEMSFTASLLDELQDSAMEEIIQQKCHRSSSSAVLLSRLLVIAAPATKPTPTATPSSSHAIPPKSIQQLMELAMWLLFDKTMGKQMHRFLHRSSRDILDKSELNGSYLAWLQWLKGEMDGMLAAQTSSTEQLINGFCSHYAANPRTAAKMRFLCAPSNHEAMDRVAWQVFIAQEREVFLSTTPLSSSAQLARHRLQPLPLARTSSSNWSGYTGTWLCMLDDVALESASKANNSRNSVPSASALLWFWRQLSCVSLTITNEENTPALLLSSVFNRSLSDNQLARLVLDNQPRWFRCLPSGESTIAVSLGSQRFGDYVAWLSTDDSINVQTYSWPSKSPISPSLYAYCWQWHIAQSHKNGLRVDVKIERGHFKCRESVPMDEEHLGTKLERVDVWGPVYELHLVYTRLYWSYTVAQVAYGVRYSGVVEKLLTILRSLHYKMQLLNGLNKSNHPFFRHQPHPATKCLVVRILF